MRNAELGTECGTAKRGRINIADISLDDIPLGPVESMGSGSAHVIENSMISSMCLNFFRLIG